MNEHRKLYHLLSLGIPLVIGSLAFIAIPDQTTRTISAAFLCLGYLVWGVIVHYKTDNPKHPKVLVEYSLIGLLGLALALSLV